jgi:hypothetical protein
MAIEIANLPSTTETFTLPTVTSTIKERRDLTDPKNSNIFGKEYVISASDPADSIIIELRRNYSPKANAGLGNTNFALKVRAVEKITDADDNVLARRPITATIALDVPGAYVAAPSDAMLLIGMAFFLMHGDNSADVVPGTDNLVDWSNGVITVG